MVWYSIERSWAYVYDTRRRIRQYTYARGNAELETDIRERIPTLPTVSAIVSN